MSRFPISEASRRLVEVYPDAGTVRAVLGECADAERDGFIRLWLTEGIPFAFRRVPMVYEMLRTHLARSLGIHEKHISLIGSARIGFSLGSARQYGREFNEESDLDIVVISREVFERLQVDFNHWKSDVDAERVHPRNDTEARYWTENLGLVPQNIARGFIDARKLPPWDRYREAQSVNSATAAICRVVGGTPGAPPIRRASVRVYSGWEECVRQVRLSLRRLMRALAAEDEKRVSGGAFPEDEP